MHLMTFDVDCSLNWGHQTSQQGKISSGIFAAIDKPSCPSAKVPINPKITSQKTNLKCTWWPLTLYEVTQLGNRTKSVQERLIPQKCPQILKLLLRPPLLNAPDDLWPRFWPQRPPVLWGGEGREGEAGAGAGVEVRLVTLPQIKPSLVDFMTGRFYIVILFMKRFHRFRIPNTISKRVYRIMG